MKYKCEDCKHYNNGFCKNRRTYVQNDDNCKYFALPLQVPITPNGKQLLAAVAAGKHVTCFIKDKRGPTCNKLKELRKKLNLPPGYRLIESRSNDNFLRGSVYIKDAKTGVIVRTLSAEDVMRILNL